MKGQKIFLITTLVVISLSTGYCQVSSWADKENWYESVREFDEEYPDVFYLVSTNILHEEGSWIARNTPEEKAILAREIRHIEMNLFRDSLNIFAPYYHQHTMDAASLEKSEYDAIAAKIVDEVYEAFRYYLKHLNGGRPMLDFPKCHPICCNRKNARISFWMRVDAKDYLSKNLSKL